MVKTRTLLRKLAGPFPKRLAKPYHDYVGLMTGKLKEEVQKIYVCLDFDDTLLDDVKAFEPDLIITHHPLIYGTRAKVFDRDPKRKDLVEALDALGYPVVSFHTNFDEGQGGMNDALAEALGLLDIAPLENDLMARGGRLSAPMKVKDFAKYALLSLNLPYGLLLDYGKPVIEKVAIVGGGGSSTWKFAQDEGYDIFISGDIPHHARRAIVVHGFNYLDVPHEVEKIFMERMKSILLNIDSTLQIKTVDHEQCPTVIKA